MIFGLKSNVWVHSIRIAFPCLDCSRVQSDFSFLLWYFRKLNSETKSLCHVQSEEVLRTLVFQIRKKIPKTIRKINDQKMFVVKKGKFCRFEEQRIHIFFIKLFEFFEFK